MPVHRAQLIVVGTFRTTNAMPWFDGWHIYGTIAIQEVLWGPGSPGTSIPMAYHDPWGDLRMRWDMGRTLRPHIPSEITQQRGIWLLRKRPDGNWGPSIGGGTWGWPGWSSLDERRQVEDDIRQCKIPGHADLPD